MGSKVAVVTGSNKGIGLSIVRGLCADAVQLLTKEGLNPKFHLLDIDSIQSIKKFRDFLSTSYGGLDVLVNNAAIAYKNAATEPFSEQAEVTTRVNFTGTLNISNELFPLHRPHARVVHVSSSAGHLSRINGKEPEATELRKQFSDPNLTQEKLQSLIQNFVQLAAVGKHIDNGWGNSAYAVSKVGVSALTRIQQRDLDLSRPGDGILVNAVHPGYVNTDMTSGGGTLTTEQGAVAPIHLALFLRDKTDNPRGAYVWFNKQLVDWVNGPYPPVF